MVKRIKRNIVRIVINTFLINLLVSSFIYELSGMTTTLKTLGEGEVIIAITQFSTIIYIAALSTALLFALIYILKMVQLNQARKNNPSTPQRTNPPDLVSVNPKITRDIIDQMRISVN